MKQTFSEKELALIAELRELVAAILEDEYEETSEYLLTWLAYASFDVKKAEQALRNNKKWRREHNMSQILKEEMKELHAGYPVHLSGLDKTGCPIMAMRLDGDIRKIVDKGPSGKALYIRYMMKHCEQTVQIIRRQHFLSGGTVNHFNAVIDMDGFCYRQMMSTKAVSALTEVAKQAEDNYPGIVKTLYVLNAPKALRMLLNIIKPFLSSNTLSRLKLFDTDRAKWEEALLQDISRDQLPPSLISP